MAAVAAAEAGEAADGANGLSLKMLCRQLYIPGVGLRHAPVGEGAMKVLKTAIAIILLLSLSATAYSQEEPATGESISAQEKAAPVKDDDRIPLYKEGWQVLVAPYLWIPGAHLNITQQGSTSVADIPWYDLVPKLFSQAIGGMGYVEIRYNRWGLFSETNFLYLSDSVSGGGARTVELPSSGTGTIPARLDLSGNLKVWTRLLWQDVGVRYLVANVPFQAEKPFPVVAFELLGGLRYTHISQDLRLNLSATLTGPPGTGQITQGGSIVNSTRLSFVEPMVGLRLGFWFTPKVTLRLRADCGGFGFVAYNNVDSILEALVGYRAWKNTYIYAGYRGRYASASNNANVVHGWFHGPVLGTMHSF